MGLHDGSLVHRCMQTCYPGWKTVQRCSFCMQHSKRVCMHVNEGFRWGFPTLDVFAGHASQQHVVSRYYTQYHAPQALAVNAMYQCWKQDARLHGNPGMVWVFPPFPLIGAVINKLLFEMVDAIFIVTKVHALLGCNVETRMT